MKKILFTFITVASFYSVNVLAAGDFGIEAGVRQQSGDVSVGDTTSQIGFQFGATGSFQINGPLYFRTGMLYTQRPLKVNGTPTDTKVSMNYLDVPLTVMYKFEDYAGVFAGVIGAFNLDHSIDNGGTLRNVKSSIFPITFGATFKFAPQLGATIYYETYSGDVADNFKNYRAVGANLLITFE